MSKKASRYQDGKQSQNGKSVQMRELRETRNTIDGFIHRQKLPNKFLLAAIGTMGMQIMVGLYYLGPCFLKELKWLEGHEPNKYMSSGRLVRRGLIQRDANSLYSLTEKGRALVEPFVEFFRVMEGISPRK